MRLIPAIDLRDGHCVRLLRGDFGAETRYDVEPVRLVERLKELGARWAHVVDLDGARTGRPGNRDLVLKLAAIGGVQIQVGGGIRDSSAIEALLHAGVARAVIGSAAVLKPDQVLMWLRRFGADAITLAFDVRLDESQVPRCVTHGWQLQTATTLWQALDAFRSADIRHVLCTDVDRDGTMAGPNLFLYGEALRRYPEIEWQASGGVRSSADLRALAGLGVQAAIAGRLLMEKSLDTGEFAPFWRNA
ncbi:MAG TPA: 1-(5-phosphoribosyl)-5-[(5-phosphoribosylamino)methylideneamino] imidazole-4-carboxamide isomerase [Steroidobacteraceae bacterium]|jgi:phosphoribosylformimino-5-aminoimidazole carboxamide ribotide isomerase